MSYSSPCRRHLRANLKWALQRTHSCRSEILHQLLRQYSSHRKDSSSGRKILPKYALKQTYNQFADDFQAYRARCIEQTTATKSKQENEEANAPAKKTPKLRVSTFVAEDIERKKAKARRDSCYMFNMAISNQNRLEFLAKQWSNHEGDVNAINISTMIQRTAKLLELPIYKSKDLQRILLGLPSSNGSTVKPTTSEVGSRTSHAKGVAFTVPVYEQGTDTDTLLQQERKGRRILDEVKSIPELWFDELIEEACEMPEAIPPLNPSPQDGVGV